MPRDGFDPKTELLHSHALTPSWPSDQECQLCMSAETRLGADEFELIPATC
jgi:hypothetical protein